MEQRYPQSVPRAIYEGTYNQMRDGGFILDVGHGATCEEYHVEWTAETYEGIRDHVTREPLDAELVRKTRSDDIEYMERFKVYEVVPIEQCYRDMGRGTISTQWLDINKGESNRMQLRSTSDVREIKASQDRAGVVRCDVLSAIPPRETVRCCLAWR